MLKKIVIVLIVLFSINKNYGQKMTLMTYNIRYGTADDGENSWQYRKDYLAAQINFYNPDFIGTQEAKPFQIEFLDTNLKNHSYIGISRSPDGTDEYAAIYYNKNKYEVLKQDTFWLAKNQNKPAKDWGTHYYRICTYGLFQDKTSKQKFWVFNAHYDHESIEAREKSSALILKNIKEKNTDNFPVFFMGDLNTEPDTKPIAYLETALNNSAKVSIQKPFGPSGSFNAFQFNKPVTRLIDYIFVSKNNKIEVKKHAILSDSKDLKYPSDHLPVYIEVTLN